MQRYVILAWAASDLQQSAAARLLATLLQSTSQEWLRGLDRSGLIVLHAGARRGRDEIYVLAGAAGIVLGRLFSHSLDPAAKPVPLRFDDREPSGILERYWGRYVAVVYDEGSGAVRVLRDPSGALPCFHTLYHCVHVFFSDVEDLLPLHLFAFSVDWKHVARTVALSVAHVRSTGLARVAEVQAGECVEIRGGSLTRSQLWNPCAIAKAHPIEDPDAAAAQLAATVAACVHAWASCHESILHNLSGGLDSSIVLACLARAESPPAITCLTYFSPDPEADERRYARLVARAARCELIEHELDASAVRLDRVLQIARSARPWFYLYDIEHSAFEARLAAEHGATALFSGAGGDSVFYLGRTELAAV
ncbi:MAG: asparagine synthase-related protein, partial [Gammaproteobacteria bacterium]